jgi:hypothetical protein
MPYQPLVVNTSGQIYGAGVANAASTEAQGIVNAAKIAAEKQAEADKMWAGAISSLGESAGSAIGTYAGVKMEQDYLQGKFDTYQARGLIDDATAKKFTEGNLGTRRGIITTQDALFDASIKNSLAQQNYNRQIGLEDYRMGQTDIRLGQPVTTYNTATGQPVGGVRTTTGSVQVLPQATVPEAKAPFATEQGMMYAVPGKPGVYDYVRDPQGNIAKPPPKSNYLADIFGPDQPAPSLPVPSAPAPSAPAPSAPAPSAAPGARAPGVPPGSSVDYAGATKMLRSNPTPEMRQYFDSLFGAGAAAAVLGE